jgi:predicted alpha/beta-fold hydrolase
MAEDVIVLLEWLGWTAKRDLHVVGISLGGMIAQGNYFTAQWGDSALHALLLQSLPFVFLIEFPLLVCVSRHREEGYGRIFRQ